MENSNIKKWWGTVVLLLIIINIATLVIFWYSTKKALFWDAPPANKSGAAKFIIKELKLDSLQQKDYQTLIGQHQAEVRQIKEEVKDAKEAYFGLLADSTVSEETIKASAAKVATIEQQIDIKTFHHFQQVRALCTPAQKKKFDTIIKDVIKMMGQQHQGPPPPRDGKDGGTNRPPPPPDDGNGPPPNGPPPPMQ